ncbi:hypothetical protein GGP41_005421 [Bipolaris sorokiniana]|uniref:Uncharacterized protein n=2 Tax=Cochliobolus sativus TaxID=45130 RepID=A0A8H6DXB4_COCSA|nr:uncharacterized protein COCSADRAFT_23398 [Bipolaris sorokiniana ND90Pr]EMD66951.1 hypothetical protein COCSADRAFT_23398 [Bipolaris sorokiniana ND90Pr]KAF5849960.1 hypothetical protein GGP41_005421 [Bipolaris sorokiniana]
MAQVVAHSSQARPASYAQQQNAPHGKKRPADGSLENEQRLSKRFDLLNLVDHNGTRLYIPVPGSSQGANSTHAQSSPTNQHPVPVADALAFASTRSRRDRKPPRAQDAMDVEDTPHRVYISDLSAELSDIESDEENPIFLSDIEKHLSKIPTHVLRGPEPTPTRDNQMVLYNVPTSLTVPEAQDNVRKAIVETRQRIRNRQVNPITEPPSILAREAASPLTGASTSMMMDRSNNIPPAEEASGDAMDID